MNLETALGSVRTALNGIANLPNAVLRFRHPDEPGMTFPFLIMDWESESRTDATPGWHVTTACSAKISVYIYVDTSADTLGLELVRDRQLVIDALHTLNGTRPGFAVRVSDAETESPQGAKWMAARLAVELSGYE